MSWLINSSIGRKLVMSITGIALVLFLTFHMSMNLVALFSEDAYNMICEFLGANWYALVGTIGLAALFIVHIVYAFILTLQNRKARGNDRYAVTSRPKGVEWASQNMMALGIIVILGLVLHLVNFWAKMQLVEILAPKGLEHHQILNSLGKSPSDGYALIKYTFSSPLYVALYIVWLAALWFHLCHGFWSSLQTIGWSNNIWFNRIKNISIVYSTIIVLGFLVVVLRFFFIREATTYLFI